MVGSENYWSHYSDPPWENSYYNLQGQTNLEPGIQTHVVMYKSLVILTATLLQHNARSEYFTLKDAPSI